MAQTSITLTASMRSNLSSLKSIQSNMDKTQEKLATGKKVNNAIDNASSYYQARGLTNRAADLEGLLDSMGQGIQTIQAANEGIEAVTAFVDQLESIANSAYSLDTTDLEAHEQSLKDYEAQYKKILEEIKTVVKDSSYQGVNLLKSGSNLKLTFNETRTNSMTIEGQDIIGKMGLGEVSWSTAVAKDEGGDPLDDPSDEQKAQARLDSVNETLGEIAEAVDALRSYSTELGNNYSVIETRQDFTEAMIDVLETGADNLVLADMNEESANYLALQTRQQLAVNSLSLASQSAQSVLSLF